MASFGPWRAKGKDLNLTLRALGSYGGLGAGDGQVRAGGPAAAAPADTEPCPLGGSPGLYLGVGCFCYLDSHRPVGPVASGTAGSPLLPGQ